MSANDRQVGGGHYKARGVEPWDVAVLNDLDVFQHEICAYVTRWREKGGLEDLKKARHWLDKYVEVEELRERHGTDGMKARLLEAAAIKETFRQVVDSDRRRAGKKAMTLVESQVVERRRQVALVKRIADIKVRAKK